LHWVYEDGVGPHTSITFSAPTAPRYYCAFGGRDGAVGLV